MSVCDLITHHLIIHVAMYYVREVFFSWVFVCSLHFANVKHSVVNATCHNSHVQAYADIIMILVFLVLFVVRVSEISSPSSFKTVLYSEGATKTSYM